MKANSKINFSFIATNWRQARIGLCQLYPIQVWIWRLKDHTSYGSLLFTRQWLAKFSHVWSCYGPQFASHNMWKLIARWIFFLIATNWRQARIGLCQLYPIQVWIWRLKDHTSYGSLLFTRQWVAKFSHVRSCYGPQFASYNMWKLIARWNFSFIATNWRQARIGLCQLYPIQVWIWRLKDHTSYGSL